jgi:hypothetical protein
MNNLQKIIIAIIIAIIISATMRFLLYKYTGWKKFVVNKGENFQITDVDPTLVEKLKFNDCIFTAISSTNDMKQYNVTSVLNGMVDAYSGNTNTSYKFKLDDPGLSIYSFQLPGFNDSDIKPDENIWADDLPDTKVILEGYYKLLNY